MPVVHPDRLAALQCQSDNVRNICILAHVDHGKTSLSDALIATNGIISPKMAGKIRYLDSRPDEQVRGITMESSAISLSFNMMRRSATDAEPQLNEYLINLIDSPGHIDFSSEVSTASRLCDGAIVLVDAVEGVCSQTVTVLRQVWIENMKPLLVINKVDRLIWELKMSPNEAYAHLGRLVEEVNAVQGSFFQGERMEEDLQWRETIEKRVAAAALREQNRGNKDPTTVLESGTSVGYVDDVGGSTSEFEEKDDESIYFAPGNNNIIFSSAVDGWAFTVRQFASLYERKLGIRRSVLEKVLWGEFYLDPKTKRVLSQKHLKGRALKPMFVQLVLDNIWAVYEATTGLGTGKGDPIKLDKITKSLSITVPPHIARSRDSRALMSTIFASWLPLSTAVLVSVIEHLPSPPLAQADRLPALIDASPGSEHISAGVRNSMTKFKTTRQDPTIAYISKMVSIPASELPENKRTPGASLSPEEARELARKKRAEIAKSRAVAEAQMQSTDDVAKALSNMHLQDDGHQEQREDEDVEEPEQLVGFARLYSGTLSVGDSVYVLPPKFSPANPFAAPEPQKVIIKALYLLMGRSLEALKSVPAGVVFGIGGMGGHVLKSGTICSQLEGAVNLAGVNMGTQPIVRVALEPLNPGDLGKMINGMRLLEQSDPCAQYEVLESGEHVISTAGELHLERCLKDLRERFAKCDIQAGEPIVPFRESIVSASEMAPPKNKDLPRGCVTISVASKQITIRLRVMPLPESITDFLNKEAGTIRQLYSEQEKSAEQTFQEFSNHTGDGAEIDNIDQVDTYHHQNLSLSEFKKALEDVSEGADHGTETWTRAMENIAAFGPRRIGPNILVDSTQAGICKRFLQGSGEQYSTDSAQTATFTGLTPSDLEDRIVYAFQLAMAQGPLCNEPAQGTAVFLEEVSFERQESADGSESTSRLDTGRLTGEVIRNVREAIRQGFLDWSPRIMLAMYSCEIQASTEVLGRVYGVITRRRGRILSEALNEGTPFFTITSVLPVAESFGFSDEIRKRTSGAASPQLRFQGFEMLDQDPFWVPFTEDELEDLGELADRENVAKRYVDAVRRRKGLLIRGAKAVEGEKARTLKR